ncbi:uncharacterized protein LOC113202024 [Frankliniella occidentalis]|uniref:Uncharacterized protein LOC113202024 n=1 Tax=Frankliniella occidentalis TaxID=133901 RepID=A0A9C6X460_FRAOC|nr:uncharacterized protein LOC113202024 [Frankliniella occidentalis]
MRIERVAFRMSILGKKDHKDKRNALLQNYETRNKKDMHCEDGKSKMPLKGSVPIFNKLPKILKGGFRKFQKGSEEHVDPDSVTSKLTSDGVLQVTAPRREALPAPKENVRHITITQSDHPAVKDAAEEAQTVPPNDNKAEEPVVGKDKRESSIASDAVVVGA